MWMVDCLRWGMGGGLGWVVLGLGLRGDLLLMWVRSMEREGLFSNY